MERDRLKEHRIGRHRKRREETQLEMYNVVSSKSNITITLMTSWQSVEVLLSEDVK